MTNKSPVTTAVPDITFTNEGISLPSPQDVLQGRLTDIDAALGGGMDKDLRTPQGQIATAESLIIARNQAMIAALATQIDPNNASGRIQDAIAKMYFLERNPGEGTIVNAVCQGSVDTVIPAGSIARDQAGYRYRLLADAYIDATGQVKANFQNLTTGPIPCGKNQLINIESQITGWASVYNENDGQLGVDVESRQQFELRRRDSVEKNAKDTIGAVIAAVSAVDGVVDWYIYENVENTAKTIGVTNVSVDPHSIYVCVSGGLSTDIAKAIRFSKGAGCGTTGNTSVTITDDRYSDPKPSYTYKYQQPTLTRCYFKVTITDNPSLPADIDDQIKKAIVAKFNGNNGDVKTRIGSNLNAGSYFNAIYSIDEADIDLISIEVSLDNANFSSRVTFGVDQQPVINENDITVIKK